MSRGIPSARGLLILAVPWGMLLGVPGLAGCSWRRIEVVITGLTRKRRIYVVT